MTVLAPEPAVAGAAPWTGPQRWGLLLALAAALVLRLFHLGTQSLWVDEILTWLSASPQAPLTWTEVVANTHGPLLSVVAHAWMGIAGDSEFALRLPIALASTALVAMLAFLAAAVAGPRALVPAAWLAALSPFLVWYGQEFRNYTLAMTFSALALLATVRYRETGRSAWLTALALSSVAGVLSNLNVLFLLPVLLGWLVVEPPEGRGRFTGPAWVAAAVAIALLPWALRASGVLELERLVPGRAALPEEEPLRGATTFTWAALPYTFYVYSVGYTLGPSLEALHVDRSLGALLPSLPWVASSAVVFTLLAWRGLRSLRSRPAGLALVLGALVVPLGAVTYLAVMNFKPFNPRYASAAVPAYLTLLAVGWTQSSARSRRVLGAVVLVLFAVSLAHHYGSPAYAKEDFRTATAYLRAHIRPEDRVVAAGNFRPLDYYWRADRDSVRLYWLGFTRDDRMVPRFEALRTPAGRTWVFVSRTHDLDPEGRFERWLRHRHHPAVATFPGVRLYRLDPVSANLSS